MSKEVKMKMQFDILAKHPISTENFFCETGEFIFNVEGIGIPFDFNAVTKDYLKMGNLITVDYETGQGLIFNETDIDADDYETKYKEMGLTSEDINARFLSETTWIEDMFIAPGLRMPTPHDLEKFNLDMDGHLDADDFILFVRYIAFYDEQGHEYNVHPGVIDSLNKDEFTCKVRNPLLDLESLCKVENKNQEVFKLNNAWVKQEGSNFATFAEYYGGLCGGEEGVLPEESLDELFAMSNIKRKDGPSINNLILVQKNKRYSVNLIFGKEGTDTAMYHHFDFNSLEPIPGPQHRIGWDKNEQLVAIGHVLAEVEKNGCENIQDLDYMDMTSFAEDVIKEYNNFNDLDKPDFIDFVTEKAEALDKEMNDK